MSPVEPVVVATINSVVSEKICTEFQVLDRPAAPKKSEFLWSCDIRDLPSSVDDKEWHCLQEILTPSEKDKVNRFLQFDDRKRAFLSIQMQRCIIRTFLGLKDDDSYEIHRTRENKPYAKCENYVLGTWNYNVSHHGNHVIIASHPRKIIGVDVMTLTPPQHRTPKKGTTASQSGAEAKAEAKALCMEAETFFGMFKAQFTERERAVVSTKETHLGRYAAFFLNWSLKESFVKAVGKGIGMDLQSADFHITVTQGSLDTYHETDAAMLRGVAILILDGRERSDWRFEFFAIDREHVVSVGYGPLGEVIDTYASGAWGDMDKSDVVRAGQEALLEEEVGCSVFRGTQSRPPPRGPDLDVSGTSLLPPLQRLRLAQLLLPGNPASTVARITDTTTLDTRSDSK